MSIDTYEVVKKLIGEIEPVGETHADNARFQNLQEMTDLVDRLVSDIDEVAQQSRHHAFSIKRSGEHAYRFLTDKLGIVE